MDIKQTVVEPLKRYWNAVTGGFYDLTHFDDEDAKNLILNLFDSKEEDNKTFADLCKYCRDMYDGNHWQKERHGQGRLGDRLDAGHRHRRTGLSFDLEIQG